MRPIRVALILIPMVFAAFSAASADSLDASRARLWAVITQNESVADRCSNLVLRDAMKYWSNTAKAQLAAKQDSAAIAAIEQSTKLMLNCANLMSGEAITVDLKRRCDAVFASLSIGMRRESVQNQQSHGICATIRSTQTRNGIYEQWVWGDGSNRYVYFENGILTAIQQ